VGHGTGHRDLEQLLGRQVPGQDGVGHIDDDDAGRQHIDGALKTRGGDSPSDACFTGKRQRRPRRPASKLL
jgi:hypothetical protein